jgi:uncharacterized protein (TIGR02265 family)
MSEQEPRPPADHLVFSHIVEKFFGLIGDSLLTETLKEKIKAVGIDLSRKLDPAYPVAIFEDALELVAVDALSHLPRTQALTELGKLQFESFANTLIGHATLPLLKLLASNEERLLGLMQRGFRQANNYVETRIEKLADGHYRVWINDGGRLPEIFQGLLVSGSEHVGLPIQVTIAERRGLECWYELKRSAAPRAG